MMNKLMYVLLFCVMGLYALKYKQMDAKACGTPHTDIPVHVSFEMPDPDLNTSLSIAEISHLYKGPRNWVALGLTQAVWNSQYEIQIAEDTNHLTGKTCLSLKKVEVVVNLKQTIFIANSAARKKCNLKTVMGHEMEHATINRDISKASVEALENTIREGIMVFEKHQGWGPYPESQSEAKKTLVQEYIKLPFENTIAEIEEKSIRENAKIDTPQEYDRLSKICPF